jgi:hypothetical protein
MKTHALLFCTALAAGLAGLTSAPARAADTSPAAPAAEVNPLARAQAQIKAKRWANAIDELKRVNATGSADWNNLMGYALRKQATPDLAGAQKHYDEALRIDPSHQGALEYAGELALMKNDLATAEKHLATLSRLCKSPCEPLDDLQKAVARFKATGKV